MDGDSIDYYVTRGAYETISGRYESSVNYLMWAYNKDTSEITVLQWLGYSYMFLGQHRESLVYFKRYIERLKTLGGIDINYLQRIGFAYWQNGFKEEAEYYFDKQIESSNSLIELRRPYAQQLYAYYDLAGVYAFRGEKDKAYANLRIFNQREMMPLFMVTLIKDDPMFDSIRHEPEFQQILRDVEAKFQAEPERVRQWLEENEML